MKGTPDPGLPRSRRRRLGPRTRAALAQAEAAGILRGLRERRW